MSLVNLVIGLVLAILVYVLGTTFLCVFPQCGLVWGLIALVVFLLVAFGRLGISIP